MACDTANEHELTCTRVLERHAAAVRQLSNGSNGDDLYILNKYVIRQLTPPCMNIYMSTTGNTAKLGAIHSNIQAAQSNPSRLGVNLQCISHHTTESAHKPTMPAHEVSQGCGKFYHLLKTIAKCDKKYQW